MSLHSPYTVHSPLHINILLYKVFILNSPHLNYDLNGQYIFSHSRSTVYLNTKGYFEW